MKTKNYLIVYLHSSLGIQVYGNMITTDKGITVSDLPDIRKTISENLQKQHKLQLNPDEIIILNIITLG